MLHYNIQLKYFKNLKQKILKLILDKKENNTNFMSYCHQNRLKGRKGGRSLKAQISGGPRLLIPIYKISTWMALL